MRELFGFLGQVERTKQDFGLGILDFDSSPSPHYPLFPKLEIVSSAIDKSLES
jgi:hypothetical protein